MALILSIKQKITEDDSSLIALDLKDDKIIVSNENGLISLVKLNSQFEIITSYQHDEEITSVCFNKSSPHNLLYASGKSIYNLDIRKFNQPVERIQCNSDDINVILQSECEKYLFSADDSGEINVIDLQSNQLQSTLKKHRNICFTLSTRPGTSELMSAGYDCSLLRWNVENRRVCQKFDMNNFRPDSSLPFINPPYIFDVRFNDSGTCLAAGLQDGSIKFWDSSKTKLKFNGQIPSGNSLGVSQVLFLEESHLVSGGNDGVLNLWDTNEDFSNQKCLRVVHGQKINCLRKTVEGKSCLIVCDTTSELTCYEIKS